MKTFFRALTFILLSSVALPFSVTAPVMAANAPPAAEAAPAATPAPSEAPAQPIEIPAKPIEMPAKPDAAAGDIAPLPATPATPLPANPEPLPAATHWTFVPEESSITFHGSQMGTAFDGSFAKFMPDIYFDADHLDQSKVTADIDLVSVDAKDSERNKNLLGPDWFDVKQFPTARFETTKIAKTGDNAYLADATLTIHGTPQVIQLPFTLTMSKVARGTDSGKDKAVMSGKITLDRSKFLLGQGDWADPGVIANDVPVEIKVTAIANGAAKTPAKPEENQNAHQPPATNP